MGARANRVAVVAVAAVALVVGADGVRGHLGSRRGGAPTDGRAPAAAVRREPPLPPLRVIPDPSVDGVPSVPQSEQAWVVSAPSVIPLRGSPETSFLRTCNPSALELRVVSGPALVLRYAGRPCHVGPLRLAAVVRDAAGTVVYRGPALDGEPLSRSFAGYGAAGAPLLPNALRCRSARPLRIRVAGAGLSASGTIRCRGQL